jgi:hypothetical protein
MHPSAQVREASLAANVINSFELGEPLTSTHLDVAKHTDKVSR